MKLLGTSQIISHSQDIRKRLPKKFLIHFEWGLSEANCFVLRGEIRRGTSNIWRVANKFCKSSKRNQIWDILSLILPLTNPKVRFFLLECRSDGTMSNRSRRCLTRDGGANRSFASCSRSVEGHLIWGGHERLNMHSFLCPIWSPNCWEENGCINGN